MSESATAAEEQRSAAAATESATAEATNGAAQTESAASTASAASPSEDDAFDKDRAMATIHKLREQEKVGKAAARERDELKTRLDALEAEKLSDEEKRARRMAELEAENTRLAAERQDTLLRLAVHSWRPKEGEPGLADADLALAALNRSEIEYDDGGQPKNLDELIPALLEAKPILRAGGQETASTAAAARIDGGAGRKSGPAPALTADELEAAKRAGMTPEAYAAMKQVENVEDWQSLQESAAAGAK